MKRDLLDVAALSVEDVTDILDLADRYAGQLEKRSHENDLLKGKVIMTMFFEHSTRTLTSFEMAAKRLGAQVVNWNADMSSLRKGETFTDTIHYLGAMAPDAIIVRHADYGSPGFIADNVDCPVINAGDSWRAHPTQALLDAMTIRQHFGSFDNLTVAIIGDIAHSRVANSNMVLLTKLGIKVRVIAPQVLMPEKLPSGDIEKFTSLKEGLPGADVVMTIRLQKERMDSVLIQSEEAYFHDYGMDPDKLDLAGKHAVAMDPGPFIRNVQISDTLVDDPNRSLILKQGANGVPLRMAVLDRYMNKS